MASKPVFIKLEKNGCKNKTRRNETKSLFLQIISMLRKLVLFKTKIDNTIVIIILVIVYVAVVTGYVRTFMREKKLYLFAMIGNYKNIIGIGVSGGIVFILSPFFQNFS